MSSKQHNLEQKVFYGLLYYFNKRINHQPYTCTMNRFQIYLQKKDQRQESINSAFTKLQLSLANRS